MPRLNQRRYEIHLMFAVSCYLAAVLLLLPLARAASSIALKGCLAVVPTLPMLWVIWLMAQRVRASDELQQRMHLLALGVTVAVVAASSLIGGFLATTQVWMIDGSVLIWVFPLMLLCYEGTRWWLARGYGVDTACEGGIAVHWKLAAVAAFMFGIGVFAYLRHGTSSAGVLLGIGLVLAAYALFKFVGYRQRRRMQELQDNHDVV